MKKSIVLFLFIALFLTFTAVSAASPEEMYDEAYSLYQQHKYFKAHELFVQSQFGDWEQMAKKCIRRWPKNGEVWHDNTQWLQDTRVTFAVKQPKDTAIFIRIYKNETPVSYVFIGGSDEITVGLPGNGKYTIKDGVGADWYDMTDAFGVNGAYETMTFGEYDDDYIYLESRYEYTITINMEDVTGQDIGTSALNWEEFSK